eukprot:791463-Karenia_brevis.AAC.1
MSFKDINSNNFAALVRTALHTSASWREAHTRLELARQEDDILLSNLTTCLGLFDSPAIVDTLHAALRVNLPLFCMEEAMQSKLEE